MLKRRNRKQRKMKSRIQGILNKKHYFNIIQSTKETTTYTLQEPAQILAKNIHLNWLQYLHTKTQKSLPVFIQNSVGTTNSKPPFGVIINNRFDYKDAILEHNLNEFAPEKSSLSFRIILPQQDLMQYFIQWQRYRKYWWSSITTTPSLFGMDDIKQGETEANVNIVARLPSGPQPVELIKMKTNDDKYKDCSCLSCTMSIEGALLMLLLDGSNNSDEDYLRLHRKIAPYKISFALSFEESSDEISLKELATLLYSRLKLERISAWLPDFSMGIEDQVRENLHMGITYTAILSEGTLKTGIFHLLNSSTLLKEQLHVADFHKYAALIC